MNRKTLLSFFMILGLVFVVSKTLPAAGKPDVTIHEATYMEGTVNMHIEWQSSNPVVMVKITIANKQQEVKVDPYDNKRNRDGYAGEVNVTVGLDYVPNQPFNYIIQLEDDIKGKSTLARGKVKIASYQQPGIVIQPQQPTMQIQIQQNITQPGFQPGIAPGTQPGLFPGIQPGALSSIQPGALPGMLPGLLPGVQPGALPGVQVGALPGVLPGMQTGALPGVVPGVQPSTQQIGSLIVIIAPLIAAESGAMWRVENGAWKRSGEFIPDLPVGVHTIEFQDLGGWIKPESQKVMIEGGQTHTINGFYNNR
jgi:hypothetical protein